MAICIQIRSIYVISLFLFLICPKTHAETNLNAQKISVANTPLEGYPLHHPEISPNDSLIAFSVSSEQTTWDKCTIWIQETASGRVWQVTSVDSSMSLGDVLVRWSPDMSRIAFSSDRGGEVHLYVVEVTNGTIRRITKNPVEGNTWQRVTWSHDGKNVIASLKGKNGDNFYSIDIETLENTKISNFNGRTLQDPDLYRDGETLLYVGDKKLETLDLTSGLNKVIESDLAGMRHPRWSPDKRWIAFQKWTNGHSGYILPSEGGNAIKVSPLGRYTESQAPSWSSDGQELIYHSNFKPLVSLKMANISTGVSTTLVDSVQSDAWWWGSWSNNSRYIALIDEQVEKDTYTSEANLYLLSTEKYERTLLANLSLVNWPPAYQAPVWQLDDNIIFSVVLSDDAAELARIDLSNFEVHILTSTKSPKHSLAISPDQELIAYVSGERANENIWIYDLVTDENYQLTNSIGQKATLVFSPSGHELMFFEEVNFESGVKIISIDDGAIRKSINIPNRFEYNVSWVSNDTISFTTGLDGYPKRLLVIQPLNENEKKVIVTAKDHIIDPVFLKSQNKVVYQSGWPYGQLISKDIKSNSTSVLIEDLITIPIFSQNGELVAYLSPLGKIEPASLWRENVAHIVSQNRLP